MVWYRCRRLMRWGGTAVGYQVESRKGKVRAADSSENFSVEVLIFRRRSYERFFLAEGSGSLDIYSCEILYHA